MEQNAHGSVFGGLLELLMSGHLIVVEGDFVGDQWAEKYLGVFSVFVFIKEVNLFGQQFWVFFLFSNHWLDFGKGILQLFVLIGFYNVADDEEETFVGF